VRLRASSSGGEYITNIGGIIVFFSWRIAGRSETVLPSLLSREALVEKNKDFRHVELDVFEVKVFLVVLLHLKQII
jgi:hypothetical protein